MNETRTPQEKVCGYEYTVRRGDSFYLIANRLGIPLRDLLEANSDINPARLIVGDVLCIPMEEDDKPSTETPAQPAPPAETPPADEYPEETPEPTYPGNENLDAPALPEQPIDPGYSVCPEENRHTVVQGETAADVQLRANINRYTLQQANPATDLDRLQAGQTLCIPDENLPCPTASAYTIRRDENLESAALRLNVSLAALLRANPCLAPSDFTPGRCILVP